MGYPTNIEWTDATWNPVGGCDIHSPGCINCYAQRLAGGVRLRNHPLYSGITKQVKGRSVFNGMLTALADDHKAWSWPISWRGALNPRMGDGKPSLIFVGDMSDLAHKDRPRAHIDRTVAGIVYSRHIGQLLTKRADVLAGYLQFLSHSARWLDFPHPFFGKPNWDPAIANFDHSIKAKLWVGFSAERQQEFDERWRYMEPLARAGWQVFVSCEPLLGRILLPGNMGAMPRKPWIIAGGESGPDARPAHQDWFRLLRDQCAEQGLPFFFKQWGDWYPLEQPIPGDPYGDLPGLLAAKFYRGLRGTAGYDWADGGRSAAIGKKLSSHFLDGFSHLAFPEAA